MVTSAGILLFRRSREQIEVLLGHMGGPFWARRDERAWSIPKGECEPGEDPSVAARREFEEELGVPVPEGPVIPLGDVRQSSGKVVQVWALEGDLDPTAIRPGAFHMEWPRGSGVMREFPEIDRADWFDTITARSKLVAAQATFVERLEVVVTREES